MPITFSDHAKKQLRRRRITQKLAIKAIQNPQKIMSSFQGRKLRRKKIGDKLLEVVTRTEGSRITVITAYYLEEKI